jgi:beta-lactamase class A
MPPQPIRMLLPFAASVDLAGFEGALDAIASGFPGDIGVVVKVFPAGDRVARNESRVLPAASTIKLPILVHLLERVGAAELTLDDRIPIPKEPRVEGSSGVLQELASVRELSVRDLATLMIAVSDNRATNLLLDRLGGTEPVQASIARWRLSETRLARRMMDFEAARAGRENLTSARDLAELLERLNAGGLVGADETRFALDTLGLAQDIAALRRGIPDGVAVEHKTGDLPGGIANDAGIVRAPAGAVIVSAMSRGPSVAAGYDAIAGIARALWAHLGPR